MQPIHPHAVIQSEAPWERRAAQGSALKIAQNPLCCLLLRTVILNVVKDPRLHFHGFGWNPLPMTDGGCLSMYDRKKLA